MTGVICSMVGATFATAVAEVIRLKKSITALGNAQVDTAQSKFGGASAYFDGTDDYLAIGDSSSNGAGTGIIPTTTPFTIECWVRINTSTANRGFITQYGYLNQANPTGRTLLYTNNSGQFTFLVNGGGTITGSTVASVDTWYHVAAVRDAANEFRLYVNGTEEGTSFTSAAAIVDSYSAIGATSNLLGFDMLGHIDEIRSSNIARYTANFTPSTTPFVNDENTIFLCHCDGTDATTYFEDDNGQRAKIGIQARGNAQVDTAQSKFGGSSALFDGSGDYLFVPSTSTFAFGTSDFTIEGWIRFVNFTSGPVFVDMRAAGGTEVKPVLYCGSDGRLYYYVNGAARITGNILSTNTWYHIALSRSGTSTKLFQDGTQAGSTYTDTNNYPATVLSLGIASWNTSFSALNGHIDEFRISNTARYTSNFTAPTQPFVNDANTLFLCHCDGTDGSTVFEDDNGVRAPKGIAAIGNAQIDTAQSKFGGASALFDGTGDYLQIPSDDAWKLGTITTVWTIEGWIRFSSLPSAYKGIMGSSTQGTNNGWGLFITTSNVLQFIPSASGGSRTASTAFTADTWQHFAVVRNGSSFKIFLDGTEVSTTSSYSNYTDVTEPLTIGRAANISSGWNGYLDLPGWLDEIRISNTARYTANFTPSTTPFQNDANTLLLLHMDGTDGSTVFTDDNGVPPDHEY